jgi:hypothetical protein
MGNSYCKYRPNFLFALDQSQVNLFLEDMKESYEQKLAKKKSIYENTNSPEDEKNMKFTEMFLEGIKEIQNSLKQVKIEKKNLYIVEKNLDMYFEYDHDTDEIDVIKQKNEIITFINKYKVPVTA